MNKLLSICLIFLAACFASQSAIAAEIQCSDTYAISNLDNLSFWKKRYPSGRMPTKTTCDSILIYGDIVAGDSDKFSKILHDNNPFIAFVYLASSGGSVEEAIKIGTMVRKYMLTTVAPTRLGNLNDSVHGILVGEKRDDVCPSKNCHCASSCFLIWAAGAERQGDMIGLHRPSNHSSAFANLPPDKSSIMYKQLLAAISQYLADMEVPPQYINLMTDTASNDIYWLKYDEVKHLQGIPPSIAESISVSCDGDVNQYYRTHIDNLKIQSCLHTKLANYRDSIN